MEYVIAGASGFLGRALSTFLVAEGHNVTALVRRTSKTADGSTWDPAEGSVDTSVLARADVVVNLAGASVGRIPWTDKYKKVLVDSRIQTTRTLAEALAKLARKDGHAPAFVAMSATGFYGRDRGEELLDEDSPAGEGFLADLVRDWEAATEPAEAAGVRVAKLRTGLVLDRRGGALQFMKLPFMLGLGGRFGKGRQSMPLIALADWLRAVRFVAEHNCSGTYNLVIPEPATNRELTKALAKALHRPAFIPEPAPLIRLALGEFSSELLGSRKVRPRRLLEAGFEFDSPDVFAAARSALS